MQRLFGVPMDTLAATLLVVLVVALGAVAALVVRNRILFAMGVRNIRRRRGRTALIVAGLMLGTAIISSALVTGDTMSHTIRSSVLTTLGNTDEVVTVRGAQSAGGGAVVGAHSAAGYFDEGAARTVSDALRRSSDVDGVAPAITEEISVQDQASRQNEPRVTLFSAAPSSMGGFGSIIAGGRRVSLADLRPGEVYLNRHAADELDATPGDRLLVFAGGRLIPATVTSVVAYRGAGTDASALLLPLRSAQTLLGEQGKINRVLVSNRGGETAGVARSDAVVRALEPVAASLGLEATPVKQDGIKAADEAGSAFMQMFTSFGMFSISAGILLIFLIFVMLAAERRGEMGIARAVGMQRGHLVQSFLFEGVAYDLMAALVGALLGVGVAFGMVEVMAGAFGTSGFTIERYAAPRSLVVAYALGVLLTFVVVTASAWRVSRLTIATAIRNLSEPSAPHRRRRAWLRGLGGLALGAVLTLSGYSSGQATSFLLGVSIIIVSTVPLARLLGVSERITYTAAGMALVVWWCLPFSVLRAMLPNFSMGFSAWVVGGLIVVLGAVWTVMYNADVLLAGVTAVFGRIRSLAPVLRTSVAYPLRSRFRTGVTLAMFTLVVFTLVVGATTSRAFTNAFNDREAFGGGFDVRAATAPFSPVPDMTSAIAQRKELRSAGFSVVSAQSFLPVDVTQAGTGHRPETYVVRGLDDAFLTHTTFGLATMAHGYHSPRQVWQALQHDDGLAVVDATLVKRHTNWSFGAQPPLQLAGFYLEDASFTPVQVQVRDPQTGVGRRLTVIGVLKDTAPYAMAGISTSQRSLARFGARVRPTVYYYTLVPGVDAGATAKALESAFLANGMQADALPTLLKDSVATQNTMNRLVLGFMGLGLVVGVAALGVVTARSVVERRQQIGVLRAIGYQRRMVQGSFLIESSFVSLVSLVVGTALGLVMANSVISDAASQPSWSNLSFAVPWLDLVVVFAGVYVAALATTFAPARKAARTYPAEALRYQ